MVHLKGLTVAVLVDGQPLTEYPDEEADDVRLSSTNRYIESRVGKEFTFRITWDASIFDGCLGLSCRILVDGVQVNNPVIFDDFRPPRISAGPKECINNVWTEKPLQFADIQLDEEGRNVENPTDLKKHVEQLGLLTIITQRIRTKIRSQDRLCRASASLESQKITEKALKGQAIDTKAALGNSRPSGKSEYWDCTHIEPLSNPFITFNWKYRSRKALQIMSIIPRTPTPEPLENRPIENLSREELVELLKRRDTDVSIPVKPEKKDVALRSIKRQRDDELDEILASARLVKRNTRIEEVEIVNLLDD